MASTGTDRRPGRRGHTEGARPRSRGHAAPAVRPVLDGLNGLGIAPGDVEYLVPTHVHLDHAGATGALAAERPMATIQRDVAEVVHALERA